MEFRPCIDIHNGQVKQIVGGSLRDEGDFALDNYVSRESAESLALRYVADGLKGGHIIMLNRAYSSYAKSNAQQALSALRAAPGFFQVGGGINPENARQYLDAGAGAVIVTSYVFSDGRIRRDRLLEMEEAVGKESLVLDLSFRERDGRYFVVTDRWQKFTQVELTYETLDDLSRHCREFLIHAADVEGMKKGPNTRVIDFLGSFYTIPVTYAGGISSIQDLELIRKLGRDHVHVTVGSALDLFDGSLPYRDVVSFCAKK